MPPALCFPVRLRDPGSWDGGRRGTRLGERLHLLPDLGLLFTPVGRELFPSLYFGGCALPESVEAVHLVSRGGYGMVGVLLVRGCGPLGLRDHFRAGALLL
ncbi:hypothetical protein ADK55_06790 [Streptomyces sp. WM4235]|nr:hypothetical protein ADK55_06790 [Streptomyces sp. WM4235]